MLAVTAAAAIRMPTLVNGLPYVRHPDEPVNYLVIHHMVTAPTLRPGFYDYPSLQYDLQVVVHSVLGNVGVWLGWWHSFSDINLAGRRGVGTTVVLHSAPWAAARMVTLIVACLGVWVVAGLATRLCHSRRWGAFGGLLAAVSGIGLSTGAVITPDSLAGTTAIVTIALLVALVDRTDESSPSRRWVITTGACLGLAVGSKYNNGALVAALAIAVLSTPRARRPDRRQLGMLGAIAVAVFVITTPAVVIDLPAFVKGIHHLIAHYAGRHDFAEGPWYTDARFLAISDGMAVLLAVAALVFSRARTTLVLAGWVIVYLLLLSLTQVHFDRNLTPVLGAVAVLAAIGGQQVWRTLHWFATEKHQRRSIAVPAGLAAAFAIALVPVGVAQARTTAHHLRHELADYQTPPRLWLERQIPKGWKVIADNFSPWLDRTMWNVLPVKLSAIDSDGLLVHAGAIVATSQGSGRYLMEPNAYPEDTAKVQRLRAMACEIRHFDDGFGYWVEVWYLRCPAPAPSKVSP